MEKTTKIEKRVEELQERLEKLESAIPLAHELMHLSERLNIPLNLCHDQLKQLVVLDGFKEKVPEIEKDDLSKIIIQSLIRGEANVSSITAKVRSLRGKASRRIISGRLEKLETLMIVEHRQGGNNEKVYRLKYSKA